MKTLLLLSVLLPATLFADGFDMPIKDHMITSQFSKKLGKLIDSGNLPDGATLGKQLKEEKSFGHDLASAPVAPLDHLNTASVYERSKDAVLCFGNVFKCGKCSKWHSNIAGGFIISEDGLAVTNYHVMDSAKAGAFGAMTIDGKLFPVKEIVASSKADDLAIVRLEGKGFKALPIAEGDDVGAEVTVISHPEGRFYSVSKGIIARYFKTSIFRGHGRSHSPGALRMAITADYAKGSSGSPVLNDYGAVVGVVSSTNSIYCSKEEGIKRDLQMVVKSCIPSGSILKLLKKMETVETAE